jgi:hypothetical protein
MDLLLPVSNLSIVNLMGHNAFYFCLEAMGPPYLPIDDPCAPFWPFPMQSWERLHSFTENGETCGWPFLFVS